MVVKINDQTVSADFGKPNSTNTPREFHLETTWKRPFPRCFNVEYTWCVCMKDIYWFYSLTNLPFTLLSLFIRRLFIFYDFQFAYGVTKIKFVFPENFFHNEKCNGLNFIENYHSVKSVRIWSFSGPHFPAFRLNTERYSVSLRFQSECGKLRARITPNTDTFDAVYKSLNEKVWK